MYGKGASHQSGKNTAASLDLRWGTTLVEESAIRMRLMGSGRCSGGSSVPSWYAATYNPVRLLSTLPTSGVLFDLEKGCGTCPPPTGGNTLSSMTVAALPGSSWCAGPGPSRGRQG